MITIQELAAIPLFDRLSDQQLTDLLESGEEVAFAVGDELFHEGAPSDSWFVLLEGRNHIILQHEPAWPRFAA